MERKRGGRRGEWEEAGRGKVIYGIEGSCGKTEEE